MLILLSIVKRNSKAFGAYGMEGGEQRPHMPREKYTVKVQQELFMKSTKNRKKAMETRIYIFNSVTHWFLLELSQ